MPFTLPCLGRGPGCATVPANHWYNWCNCLLGRHDNHHTNLHLPQVTLNPFTPPFMKFLSHLPLPHLSHEKEIYHYSSVPHRMIVQHFKQYSNSIQMHWIYIPNQTLTNHKQGFMAINPVVYLSTLTGPSCY